MVFSNSQDSALNKSCFNLPLFPLSAHILPGGRMALRIFEPRYLRMVKEACSQGSGFGICMLNPKADKTLNHHIYPIATFVSVVDFTRLDDGLLGVTVAAKDCCQILKIQTQKDELRVGQCEWLSPWESGFSPQDLNPLRQKLQKIFQNYPELEALYAAPTFDDPDWVMLRWLELLPIGTSQKQHILQQKDYRQTLNFLTQLIQ